MGKTISVQDIISNPTFKKIVATMKDDDIKVDLEKEIKIPYVIKDKILMSPGVWNGYYYSPEEIKTAFENTNWEDKDIRSLYLDHMDGTSQRMGALTWVGEVLNIKLDGEELKADLVIVDKPTAIKLAYGAKMGISPKVHGDDDEGRMKNFYYDNFSVVINPAIKTAYVNNSEDLDLVYEKYNNLVNMSYSELKEWSENPCSNEASLDRGPIERNLHLLSTKKEDWDKKEIEWANKTIAFISRMKNSEQGEKISEDCPYSKRDISLRNWAYNPSKKSENSNELSDKKPYGEVSYADPGYQKDGIYRYPLNTESHVKSAWSYINMPKNQKFYTEEQLEKIINKIKQAAKRFDIEISEKLSEQPNSKIYYDTYITMLNYSNKNGELIPEELFYQTLEENYMKYEKDYYNETVDSVEYNNTISKENQEETKMTDEKKIEEQVVEKPAEDVVTESTEVVQEQAPVSNEMSSIVSMLEEIKSTVMANSNAIKEMQEAKKEEEDKKEEPVKEEEKKEDKVEEKMSEKDNLIQEMSEKIKQLETKVNEPERLTVKTVEMSQRESVNSDEAFLRVLSSLN